MNERKAYPSDLTDEQWEHIRILLPRTRGKGRRPTHSRREMLNAILYIVRTGSQWRAMPHDLPPWQTVYDFFRKLCRQGVWEDLNTILRQAVRQQAAREPEPSVVILDSQSVKTTEKGGLVAMMATSVSRDGSGTSRLM